MRFGLTIFALCLAASPAYAYIGPGLTIALAGYFSWPIAVLAGLFSILIYYPLRYLWRKVYKKKTLKDNPATKDSTKKD